MSIDFSTTDPLIAKKYRVECCLRKHLDANLTYLPNGRSKSRNIKKLLHEYEVPPWIRDQIVFIIIDQQLVEAVGLWSCQYKNLPSLNLSFTFK